jgi:hypothetical protein
MKNLPIAGKKYQEKKLLAFISFLYSFVLKFFTYLSQSSNPGNTFCLSCVSVLMLMFQTQEAILMYKDKFLYYNF